MLTLGDIQTAQFQQASGFCTTRPEFLELVNDAVDGLMRRGDWPGTLVPVRLCVRNGCVTFPRYVGEVRKVNNCTSSVAMRNVWYQFLEHGHPWGPNYEYAWNWSWRGSCGAQMQMLAQYRAPTYNDIYGDNCYVRVYPMAQEDEGATVTIFGTDNNNQPLMTRTDGVWSEGITLTIPANGGYASSSTPVSKIERVVKSVTQNKLNLFAYDATNDVLYDLASYEPSETSPNYLRYQLQGGVPATNTSDCAGSNCSCQTTIIALVKLQQVPLAVSNDLVVIDNRHALLNAIRALKSEEAGNYPQALTQWKVAVESLNRDAENSSPDFQFSAKSLVFGGRQLTNRQF
jgi:hypothetical protein